MGLEFLRDNGGRRVRSQPDQPELDPPADDEGGDDDTKADEPVDRDYEAQKRPWAAVDIEGAELDPDKAPRRFVDGCHVGHTIAWIQDAEGHPIPLMLSTIGGVCLEADGRELRRAFEVVERVVALIVDPFPWDQIEDFAIALAGTGFRLVPASAPKKAGGGGWAASYDFEAMRKKAQNRSNYEMEVLEEAALCRNVAIPTVVDGRLEPRINSDSKLQLRPIVGVVKQQRKSYLHPAGWRVYYHLRPGQRTPAFLINSKNVPVVSWYLKLDGAHGSLPNWGVVRVEIAREFFEKTMGSDFAYVDGLSNALMQMRCRLASYRRGPVSLAPIVRAEEVLRALFPPPGLLAQQFYRLTGI